MPSRPSIRAVLSHPSNLFFVLGGMAGVAAVAHPCPTCFASTGGFFVRGAMERVGAAKAWMSKICPKGAE